MTETAMVQNGHGIQLDDATTLKLVAGGDTSTLSPAQKLAYYRARCEAAGLDPRTHPFEFTKLSGREVLYAKKAASDALASKHGIVAHIMGKETVEGVHIVTVRATARDGRETDDIGAVNIASKKGDDLANALMKAVTKAKRRAILSLCGLGMLDETELETVPGVRPAAPRADRHTVQVTDVQPESAPASAAASTATVDVQGEASPPASPVQDVSPSDLSNQKKAAEFIASCGAGFETPAEQAKWFKDHLAEINALPNGLKKAVKAAYDHAGPKS